VLLPSIKYTPCTLIFHIVTSCISTYADRLFRCPFCFCWLCHFDRLFSTNTTTANPSRFAIYHIGSVYRNSPPQYTVLNDHPAPSYILFATILIRTLLLFVCLLFVGAFSSKDEHTQCNSPPLTIANKILPIMIK